MAAVDVYTAEKALDLIEVGYEVLPAVFDPEERWTVDPEQFQSKGRNCPWNGRELIGRTVNVTLYTTGMFVKVKDVRDGTIIYDSMEQSPFPGIGGAELVERGVRFHDMMGLKIREGE